MYVDLETSLLNTHRNHSRHAWTFCSLLCSCCLGLLVAIGAHVGGADASASIARFLWPGLDRAGARGSGRPNLMYGMAPEEFLDKRPRLTVRGASSRKVPADEARVQIVVKSSAQKTASDAMAYVKERMVRVGAFLDEMNIKIGKERQTGAFDLRPIWSQRPSNASEDWQPHIVGYEVEQRTIIETSRLELIGDLLAKTAQHGANVVNLEGFFLSKKARAALREELLAEAVRNARAEALAVATAAGRKLGPVLSIQIDSEYLDSRPMNYGQGNFYMQARSTMPAGYEAPDIEPGAIEVSAAIHGVFLIEDGV